MFSDFGLGLIVPAVILSLMGWFVPKWLGTKFAEGVSQLVAVAVVATFVLFLLGGALFVGLYLVQGAAVTDLAALGVGYFLTLGGMGALLWAPFMILSIIGLPKSWVEQTW